MAVSKTELIDDLKAHGLYQTAKFVESGFLLPSDLIFYKRTIPITEKDSSGDDKTTVYTQYPLADSFEKHLDYRINITKNYDNENMSDRKMAFREAEKLCELFEKTYNIPVQSSLRFKSPKSIAGKIITLEIERISKLIALKAAAPKETQDEQFNYIARVNRDPNLTPIQKKIKNEVQSNDYEYNREILNTLLKGRVAETYFGDERAEYYKYIDDLLDPRVPLDYDQITSKFFGNDNFSADTQSALARIFFYRVVYDKNRIVSDGDKSKLVECTDEFKSRFTHENFTMLSDSDSIESNPLKKAFKYASIQRIIESSPEWKEDCFVHRYSSRLERLVDEDEFLRVKDLIGMNIVAPEKLQAGYHLDEKTENQEINKLNKSLNERLSNIFTAEDYSSVEERKLYTIFDDFSMRVKNNYFNDDDKLKCKILPDSLKQWRKWGKSYLANHIKFEIADDPMSVLEVHLESDVIDKFDDKSHIRRKGKKRDFPELIIDMPYDMSSLSFEKQAQVLENYTSKDYLNFLDNLYFYLPFYNTRVKDEKTGKHYYKDNTIEENCRTYYGIYNKNLPGNERQCVMYRNLHWMLSHVRSVMQNTHVPKSINKEIQTEDEIEK